MLTAFCVDGMEASRLRVDDELILEGENTFDFGVESAQALLHKLAWRPTAIFASGDSIAAGLLATAHELGVAVPTHLSIAGFGDQPIARQVWPALTTLRWPMTALAERATVLVDLLRGTCTQGGSNDVPVSELVVRHSTGVCSRVDEPTARRRRSPGAATL